MKEKGEEEIEILVEEVEGEGSLLVTMGVWSGAFEITQHDCLTG